VTAQPLRGKNIVVTRAAHQARGLAELIRAAGGHAVLFPVIEIRDVEHPESLFSLIDRLDCFDLAIFVSPNAATRAMALIGAGRALPPGLAVAAIGAGTARTLRALGVAQVIVPAGRYDSEGLLEVPALKEAAGRRVVIFRGEGGRELLGETLRARGATVEYAECYRRARTGAAPAALIEAWERDALDAVTATSSETLRNLWELLDERGRDRLRTTPLFVPHRRIAATARELGVVTVILTGPGDAGLVAGLAEYFGALPSGVRCGARYEPPY
jgi:uroporphyrinogen-III synthase